MLHGYDIKIPPELLDSDDEDNGSKSAWSEDAYMFVNEVILVTECEVFKKAKDNVTLKGKIKSSEGMIVGEKFIEFYLTQVYKQVADKESTVVVEKFEKYAQMCRQKPLFMLNLISNVIQKVHPMMERSKFDDSSFDNYKNSVAINLGIMKKYIINELETTLKKLEEVQKVKWMPK